MTPVYLALGGNLGSVEQSFEAALDELSSFVQTGIAAVSTTYRFPAVGTEAGGEFHNAAACVDTALDPLELLTRLQQVEDRLGRVRDTRWGPRPIDLDIIFYGSRVIEHPRLKVPHPACWYRRFVLDPLAEIAADFVHPEKGIAVNALKERLLVRPLPVMLVGGAQGERLSLAERLGREFAEVSFLPSSSVGGGSVEVSREPALLVWLGPDESARWADFDALPVVPRLDASSPPVGRDEFLRDVLHSALGS